MSRLRQQLDDARREHLATRYPGDLAADIARTESRRSARRLIFGGSLAAAAIAACVMIVVYVRSTNSGTGSDRTTIAIDKRVVPKLDENEGITFSVGSVPSWTDVTAPSSVGPGSEAMVPPAWSVVPTIDVLSSVPATDNESGTNSQSKETT